MKLWKLCILKKRKTIFFSKHQGFPCAVLESFWISKNWYISGAKQGSDGECLNCRLRFCIAKPGRNQNFFGRIWKGNAYSPRRAAYRHLWRCGLLLVNKPPGILVHPDGTGKLSLDNLVAHRYLRKGPEKESQSCLPPGLSCERVATLSQTFPGGDASTISLKTAWWRNYIMLSSKWRSERASAIDLRIGRDRHRNNRYRVSKTTHILSGFAGRRKALPAWDWNQNAEGGTKSASISAISGIRIGDGYYGKNRERLMCMHFIFPFNIRGPEERKEFFLPSTERIYNQELAIAYIHRHQISRLPWSNPQNPRRIEGLDPKANYTKKDNIHLTLAFLGT